MVNRVLILGGDGMLGHKVFQVFNETHETHATFLTHEHYASAFPTYREVPSSRIHLGIDALSTEVIERLLNSVRPDVVVNCIGLIKQLKEASDFVLAIRMNSLLPHNLAGFVHQLIQGSFT